MPPHLVGSVDDDSTSIIKMCGNWRILREYMGKIVATNQWEELSLLEEEIIPREFDRDMKTNEFQVMSVNNLARKLVDEK